MTSTFAIVETGGKQYKIAPGQKIKVEKLAPEKRASASGLRQSESAHPNEESNYFVFDKVLLKVDGDEVKIGMPYLNGETVEAKVLQQGRDKKKIVFRYHSKTRYRKKKGHRQPFTEVEILKI